MPRGNDSDSSTSYDSLVQSRPITSNIFTNPTRLGIIQQPTSTSQPPSAPNDLSLSLSQEDLEFSFSSLDLSSTNSSYSAPDFNMGDSTLMPEHFTGRDTFHSAEWLDRFAHFDNFKRWTDAQKIEVFPLFLKDAAYLWYKDLIESAEEEIVRFDEIEKLFKDKYVHPTDRWALLETFVSRKLSSTESIDTYLADLTETASLLGKTDADVMDAFVRGLDDNTRRHVLMKQPNVLNEAVSFARLARSVIPQSEDSTNVMLAIDTLRLQIVELSAKLAPVSSQINTYESRQNQRPQFPRQSRYTDQPWQPTPQWTDPIQGDNMARGRQCYRCGESRSLLRPVWVLFTLMALVIIQNQVNSVHTELRLPWGVVFIHTSRIDISQNKWIHVFKYKLPDLSEMGNRPDYQQFCKTHALHCYSVNAIDGYIKKAEQELLVYWTNVSKDIKILIPHVNTFQKDSRTRRAILPFIGSISRSIFGTATVEDVERLAQYVKRLSMHVTNTSRVVQVQVRQMSSFIAKTNDRISSSLTGIETNHRDISQVAEQVQDVEKSIFISMKILLDRLTFLTTIRQEIDEMYLGIQQLVNQRLSPSLLPVTEVKKALNMIQKRLNAEYPLFHVAHKDPGYYYRERTVHCSRTGDSILISLIVPFQTHSTLLEVYRINSFGLPINQSSSHVTQVMNLPDYLAVSEAKDQYIEFSTRDFQTCFGEHKKHCPIFLSAKPNTGSHLRTCSA
ncbi:uncharacterized protein LOC124279759 [Haliotis rubra]|uniref:uncharacterized protein LOC124279759 n=1 Tax=Haliotis rubra TaxID=36100 RepID=UPI001EE58B27|nr:uncharacterized protein LOC124279759 [Haliotis rubra]